MEGPENSRRCIAIVDDDAAILDSTRLLLELHGWDVHTYLSGEDFLHKLSACEPRCIILDPHLLGLSGAEVAREIARTHAHVPIVGLTARPHAPATREATAAGVRIMLTKPIPASVLVATVAAAVARADALRASQAASAPPGDSPSPSA